MRVTLRALLSPKRLRAGKRNAAHSVEVALATQAGSARVNIDEVSGGPMKIFIHEIKENENVDSFFLVREKSSGLTKTGMST